MCNLLRFRGAEKDESAVRSLRGTFFLFVFFSRFNRGRDEFCARFVQRPPPSTSVAEDRHVFFFFFTALRQKSRSHADSRLKTIKNRQKSYLLLPTHIIIYHIKCKTVSVTRSLKKYKICTYIIISSIIINSDDAVITS